jgi:hypothetical protein
MTFDSLLDHTRLRDTSLRRPDVPSLQPLPAPPTAIAKWIRNGPGVMWKWRKKNFDGTCAGLTRSSVFCSLSYTTKRSLQHLSVFFFLTFRFYLFLFSTRELRKESITFFFMVYDANNLIVVFYDFSKPESLQIGENLWLISFVTLLKSFLFLYCFH